MTKSPAKRLSRAALSVEGGRTDAAPRVRIVHMGLGAFSRAHQAWYTDVADGKGEWGIAAFTGRSPAAADELAPQDGLFTLIERSAERDTAVTVSSIVEAHDGADLDRFVELLAAPETALLTLTVTEAGYRLTPDGRPNGDDAAVQDDIGWLATALAGELPSSYGDGPVTILGRLLLGLHARRIAGGGQIAVVPCDNVPDNGRFVRRGVLALAELVDAATAEWIATEVSFVSTSVDRITPKTTPRDLETATALTGFRDNAPVVTEPFSDWVLSGDFPAGRPEWERAGARFVENIEPFERRKLWLLNGAHSLLAYAGRLKGHETVASAIVDPECRAWVLAFWDEATELLGDGLDLDAYRSALLGRFENARIEHRLAQISTDAVTKLGVRVAPIILAERAAGRSGHAALRAVGSWVALVLSGANIPDASSAAVTAALSSGGDVVAELVRVIDQRLVDDAVVLDGIRAIAEQAVSTRA